MARWVDYEVLFRSNSKSHWLPEYTNIKSARMAKRLAKELMEVYPKVKVKIVRVVSSITREVIG